MRYENFYLGLLICIFIVLNIFPVSAELGDDERRLRLEFGRVAYIDEVTIDPEEIIPGSSATINLKISNIDTDVLRDIIIRLELPAEFAPAKGEIIEKKIRIIDSLETEEIGFGVTALPDSEIGIYKIPFSIGYTNKFGTFYQENNTISVIVSSTPEIFALVSKTELYKGNNIGDVTVNIVNSGLTDVKLLIVELQENSDYKIIGTNRKYIGDLDSDDYESASFKLNIGKRKKQISLPLVLNYKDANNRNYEKNIDLDFKIYSKEEAGKDNGNGKIIIAIIVLAVACFFIYKKYYKKKKRR